MGRWTQYDEDDYRLPEGMKRVGYDADSSKYIFRDTGGCLWEGQEGNRYGEMTQVSDTRTTTHNNEFNSRSFGNHDRLDLVVEVPDTCTATHNSDKDDMEEGSVRDGYRSRILVQPFTIATKTTWRMVVYVKVAMCRFLRFGRHCRVGRRQSKGLEGD